MCVCVCSGVGRFKKFSVNQVTFSTFWKPSPIIRSRCTHTQARTRAALSGGAAGGGSGGPGPGPGAEPPRPRKRHGGLETRGRSWLPQGRRGPAGALGVLPGRGAEPARSRLRGRGPCAGWLRSAHPAPGTSLGPKKPRTPIDRPRTCKNKKPKRQNRLKV